MSDGSDWEGVRVKVCGITRLEDARAALDHGAWALGFIFHPSSPRYIEPKRAREIIGELPEGTRSIGVFVDRPGEEVRELAESVGLYGVQLHGSEPPELVGRVGLGVELCIKAFRVGPDFRPEAVDDYPSVPVLLDTYRADVAGGTGETFDWSVARGLAKRRRVILAGGLGPQNVRQAVDEVHPFAVDVSSRLEARPGVKDPRILAELFEVLRG